MKKNKLSFAIKNLICDIILYGLLSVDIYFVVIVIKKIINLIVH